MTFYPKEDFILQDLEEDVFCVDFENQKVVTLVSRLLGCECCSEQVEEEYNFSELTENDRNQLLTLKPTDELVKFKRNGQSI